MILHFVTHTHLHKYPCNLLTVGWNLKKNSLKKAKIKDFSKINKFWNGAIRGLASEKPGPKKIQKQFICSNSCIHTKFTAIFSIFLSNYRHVQSPHRKKFNYPLWASLSQIQGVFRVLPWRILLNPYMKLKKNLAILINIGNFFRLRILLDGWIIHMGIKFFCHIPNVYKFAFLMRK